MENPLISRNLEIKKIEYPYSIWIIDNFLSEDSVDRICLEWESSDSQKWHRGHPEVNGKKNILESGMLGISKKDLFPKYIEEVMNFFHSEEFSGWVEKKLGLSDLIPDPAMRWSGMRTMLPGSYQMIHSDARRSPETNMKKELTLLLYLSKDYDRAKHTGNLEIWDDDMTNCLHSIEPSFNRMVIFQNSDKSYHGVPEVNFERRAITFSILKKETSDGRSKALFVSRPQDSEDIKIQGIERSKISDKL